MTKNQARGYLYEIIIAHLLESNSFLRCQKKNAVNRTYKCGVSSKDGEVLGRGTHHQIDFVGIYEKNIPFVYPIRLLAECKFWTKKNDDGLEKYKSVSKSFIREYIGVYKDISENYFSLHMKQFTRFLDVPIIFSAGGFDTEAEKLAWAHGINIVSHSKLPIMQDILYFINFIIDNFPEDFHTNKNKFKTLKKIVSSIIKGELSGYESEINILIENIRTTSSDADTAMNSFTELLNTIRNIRYNTFLFATTEHGKLLNLISYDTFPDDMFSNTDLQECAIYFNDTNIESSNDRVFYITLNNDNDTRKFYFQANEEMMIDDFSSLSLPERIHAKESFFTKLSILKEINGLTRLITLKVNFENIMNRVR